MRAEKIKTIITILLLLVSTSAIAQQQTIYGPDGKARDHRQPRITHDLRT